MKFFVIACMLHLVSSVAAESGASGRGAVFAFPTEKTVLENGLTVITVPTDAPDILSYWTVVRTGSRNEVEPGLSGFAHFFEHMMFRGTATNSPIVYAGKLKKFGVETNAFTSSDWTAYHITGTAASLPLVMELEADRFQNLEYDLAGFQKEALAVEGEYMKNSNNPSRLMDEILVDNAFSAHTYKHTTMGFLKDIKDMPNQYAYSRKFFERWYRPDNCFVVVVGDVSHSEVVQLAKRNYGNWKPGVAHVDIPVEPPQSAEKRVQIDWKGISQPRVLAGFHVPAFDPKSKKISALDVISGALFSPVGSVYKKLVLQDQKVEGIYGGYYAHRDPHLFEVEAVLKDAADFDVVEQTVYAALARAAVEPLPFEFLEKVKSNMRYTMAGSLNTPYKVGENAGAYIQLTGRIESINEQFDTIDSLTPEDIMEAAREFFVAENRTVVRLVGSASETKIHPIPALKMATPKAASGQAAHSSKEADKLADAWVKARKSLKGSKPSSKPVAPAFNRAPKNQGAIKSPLVAVRVVFRAGSQNDPKGKEGLAALSARLMSEGGTKSLSYEALLERFYPMAADVAASADKELTVFQSTVHQDVFQEFSGIFSEMLVSPRLDPKEFKRLKDEQLNYLKSTLRGSNDEELGKWSLQLQLYPTGHPYGHVDQGTVSGLNRITLDDVRAFIKKHYTASAVTVGLVGGADELLQAKFEAKLKKALPQGKVAVPKLAALIEAKDLQIKIIEKPTIATAISIGHPLSVNRSDDDFYLLALANSALGQHRTFEGRLMRSMRQVRGLNYGDYSYIENFMQDDQMSVWMRPNIARRQQYFSIWIRPVPHAKAVFALREAIFELNQFVEKGLSQEEFEATRNYLFNYTKLYAQTGSQRLGYEIDGKFYGKKSYIQELADRLPTMTLESVNAAIKKHIQAKNLYVSMVTEDGKTLHDAIVSKNPSPFGETKDLPESVIAENKVIESWPLNASEVKVVPVNSLFE